MAHAAVVASRLVEAPAIVAISDFTGGAARLLSEYRRSEALVIGMTRKKRGLRPARRLLG